MKAAEATLAANRIATIPAKKAISVGIQAVQIAVAWLRRDGQRSQIDQVVEGMREAPQAASEG